MPLSTLEKILFWVLVTVTITSAALGIFIDTQCDETNMKQSTIASTQFIPFLVCILTAPVSLFLLKPGRFQSALISIAAITASSIGMDYQIKCKSSKLDKL